MEGVLVSGVRLRRQVGLLVSALALVGTLVVAVDRPASAAPFNVGTQAVIWGDQIGDDGGHTDVFGVAVASDGSVYVVGGTFGDLQGTHSGSDGTDAFVRKYDDTGEIMWTDQFGFNGSVSNAAAAVAIGSDGKVFVVGFQGNASGQAVAFLREYDPVGGGLENFDSFLSDDDQSTFAYGVTVDAAGNIYVVGRTLGEFDENTALGEGDAFVRRYPAGGGASSWTTQFGTASQDWGTAVAVDATGVYTVGYTAVDAPRPGFIFKHDFGGNLLWDELIDGDGFGDGTEARAVAAHPDGSVVVVGDTLDNLTDDEVWDGPFSDVFIRMFSSSGTVLWTDQFGNSGTGAHDRGSGVAVDPDGVIRVIGTWDGDVGPVPNEDSEVFVRRYAAGGDLLGTTWFDSTGEDGGSGIAVNASRLILAGATTGAIVAGSPTPSVREGFVVAFDLTDPDPDPDPDPSVVRYAGANRFETAVEVSKNDFPSPAAVDTVFVAVGNNFPDALAGSAAAAALDAPLLLVNTTSIPGVTAAELTRLDPDTVVILGGTAVISAGVASQLAGWGTVERWAGANRYATAATISSEAFGDASLVDEVIVATGANFPDALGGGPVAAALGGPVLLVPSTGVLPDAVKAELTRLGPARITVLGGEAAVSSGVFTQLQAYAATVERKSGANRYATAVEASKHGFGSAERVYVAVGTNFPDALAGAAAAGIYDAPVLLTPTLELPAEVSAEITRLGATTVIILGGPNAVSVAVENALKTLLGI